jgi:pimeloyl-ACP methyl ester carboxylesterase
MASPLMPSVPFREMPYADVPELPLVPHRWCDTVRRDITLHTKDLGDVRVALRTYGSGPPLMLVHGMGTTGYSWRYLLESLGRRFQLFIPDLPGAGDSDHPDLFLGPEVQARALIALLGRDPERWIHKRVHYLDESLKSREEHRVYAKALHERAGRRTYYRQLRDTLDTRGMRELGAALQRAPFPIPLWLVYAPRDPMVPPIVGDRLRALIPGATFVKLETGSHFAHVDAPAHFLAAIEPFLAAKS